MQATTGLRAIKIYRFGAFRLENKLLLLNGRSVQIPPRALAVLQLLVEEEGALVTKEDLIQKVWSGAFIEESNVTKSIAEIRRVLRSGFGEVDPIRTVWKQGYCFDVTVTMELSEKPVTQLPEAPAPEPETTVAVPVLLTTVPVPSKARRVTFTSVGLFFCVVFLACLMLNGKPDAWGAHPKVAVLGIRNISGDRSSDWLSTALTETLTSELQSEDGLRAVSADRVAGMRNDLGVAPGAPFGPASLQKVRANLGCQLAITGTFLVSASGLRLDLHIQDTATGDTRHTLSETGTADNLFDLVARTGADLRRKLGEQPQVAEANSAPVVSAEALRLYSQGLEHLRKWDTAGAQQFFTQALQAGGNYAPIHAGLSRAWSLMGFDQRARDEARLAVETSTGLPREQELQIEARYAEVSADWPKAIETWRALWRFYPEQLDYAERLAFVLTMGGKAGEAVDMLRNLRSRDPRVLLAQATASFALSDYRSALDLAGGAGSEARTRSARMMESRAYTLHGESLRRLSEFEKAVADFQAAGRISAALGDRSGVAEALVNEADASKMLGNGKAEPALLQAKSIATEIGNRSLVMRTLSELAAIHRERADMAGAIQLVEQALALARETGNGPAEALSLNDLGNLLNNTGNPAGARERYLAALSRGTEAGNRRAMALASGNLGILDFFAGDLARATDRFEEALALKRQMGDRDSIGYTLVFLGRVALAAGRLREARGYWEEADGLFKSIHEASISPVIQLARLAISEGRPEDAEAPLSALAAKFTKPAPACEIWYLLAESWLARGNLEKARDASARATALAAKTPNRADFGIPAGVVAARVETASGHFAKARADLDALLAEARKLKHVPNELNIRFALASLEKGRGNDIVAAQVLRSLQRDASHLGFGLIASASERIANPRFAGLQSLSGDGPFRGEPGVANIAATKPSKNR